MAAIGYTSGLLTKLLAVSIALAASVSPAHAFEWKGWTELSDEDGIRIWQRKIENSGFVAFRGQMVMQASIKKLLAVLHDQERKMEWMHNCAANDVIERRGLGKLVIYNRTAVNVLFVSDRDVVVETSLTIRPMERRVRVDAWSVTHPDWPEQGGAVRMRKLKLIWDLVSVSPELTEVTYEVQADPGGWLPAWLVNRVSKKIPYHSLEKLNRQAAKPYPKALAYIEKRFDWASLGM